MSDRETYDAGDEPTQPQGERPSMNTDDFRDTVEEMCQTRTDVDVQPAPQVHGEVVDEDDIPTVPLALDDEQEAHIEQLADSDIFRVRDGDSVRRRRGLHTDSAIISLSLAINEQATADSEIDPSDWKRLLEIARLEEAVADAQAEADPLSSLAGAVGHELYNPLTSCIGYLHQLSTMIPAEDEHLTTMLQRLGRNLNRIHSIVGELEILADEASGEPQEIRLDAIVERVHRQLSSYLETDVDLDLHRASLQADRARVTQLVYIVLATHMLHSDEQRWCSVYVNANDSMTRLDVTSPSRPGGSLRLDLLGILRQEELPAASPLELASQLTAELDGVWQEGDVSSGYRTTAFLPVSR